jgi:ABC-type protease/lipase transport system fused ATPase/permease subunit
MAMVLHSGSTVAFGPREHVLAQLARVTSLQTPAAAARTEVSRVVGGARP